MSRSNRLPKVLSRENYSELIDQFNDRYRPPHRNRVMLRLMGEAGLRVGEVVALKLDHVNLNTGQVIVREGKGAKDRHVYVNPDLLDDLREWVGREDRDEGYLFTTSKGTAVGPRYVRKVVKREAEKAGIPELDRVSPHTLRHSYATWLYEETGNLRLVQENLGHASIKTTQIYTHVADGKRAEASRNFNPMESVA